MWHKARAALSLPSSDQLILAQAWILLLAVDIGLRCLPFQQVQKCLSQGERPATSIQTGSAAAQVRRLDCLVRIAGSHHLYAMTCLRQALVLKWFLDKEGIETDLRIGVKREQDQFQAHAWIEYQHQPVGEPGAISSVFSPMVMRGND